MTNYEKAAIRMTIKHYKKLGKENAENHIKKWVVSWKEKGVTVDEKGVRRAVKLWALRNSKYNRINKVVSL